MSKGRPRGVETPGGGDTVTPTTAQACATCCLNRRGSEDFTGRDFKRIYQQYGRATVWFKTSESASYSAGPVTWENFYYRGTYGFKLDYQVRSATNGPANGTITVTLRIHPTVHDTDKPLRDAAPSLFTTVTQDTIERSVTSWNEAIQHHWTNRYTVRVGAPDCPGDFPMAFGITKVTSNAHVTFTVLDMKDPRDVPSLRTAMGNPEDPLHGTATSLFNEWRSHAGKFNVGDIRGTLVFAHEYGHWMGWGDEYIEVRGTNAAGNLYEIRNNAQVSLRVAIKIKNPTKVFRDANGTDIEIVDITRREVRDNLMSSMGGPTYSKRNVYTVVHDFIALYNKTHYGGASTAYCIDVLTRR